jgi:hypothetical protein
MTKVAAAVLTAALTLTAAAAAQSGGVVITRAEAQGVHPFVAWALAPGWCSNVVEIAKSPETGSDGAFFSENVIDAGAVADKTATSWLSSAPSLDKPGTYYARVQAYACDFSTGPEWSATASFVKSPPPPPPTPKGVLVVHGWNGFANTTRPLSKVSPGQRIAIDLKATTSAKFAMRANGLFCTLTRSGNFCRVYGNAALSQMTTRISRNMIVRGRVIFSALYRNPSTQRRGLVAKKTLKVVLRNT